MKTKIIFSFVSLVLLAAASPAFAGRGGGGGCGGSGFHGGGFAGGGFRGGGPGIGHVGGISTGGFRAAVPAYGGAHFAGGSFSQMRTPQFSYYSHAAAPRVSSHAFVRQVPKQQTAPNAGRPVTTGRQSPTHITTNQNTRPASSHISAAAQRAITNHQVYARHDGQWHRDWDKKRFHHWGGHWWGWYGGYWLGFDSGFYPGDYWAYGDYPADNYGYPYGYYSGYPYGSYDYEYDPNSYYDDSGDGNSGQSSSGVLNAVQSQLAKLGYYRGAVDGILGDETQAAIARYQEDHDLSVTGTVTAAMLYSLGLTPTAG